MHATARVIAFANQKGGVAKTTTTLNLAAAFAEEGHRVLCVDMDPQGNLTMSQGIDPDTLEKSMYDVLVHRIPIREVTQRREVDVACASIDLAGAEIAMSTMIGRERSLAKALDLVAEDYDFICIDTPPSLGLLTINALTAAHKVIVPVQCEYLSMRGLIQLQNTLAMIREHLNPDIDIAGILPTLVDSRTIHAKEAIEILEENFGDRVFASRIRKTVRFAEAPVKGMSVLRYETRRSRGPVISPARAGGSRQWQVLSAQACARARWRPCSARRRSSGWRIRPRPPARRRPRRPRRPAAAATPATHPPPASRARRPRRPAGAPATGEPRAATPSTTTPGGDATPVAGSIAPATHAAGAETFPIAGMDGAADDGAAADAAGIGAAGGDPSVMRASATGAIAAGSGVDAGAATPRLPATAPGLPATPAAAPADDLDIADTGALLGAPTLGDPTLGDPAVGDPAVGDPASRIPTPQERLRHAFSSEIPDDILGPVDAAPATPAPAAPHRRRRRLRCRPRPPHPPPPLLPVPALRPPGAAH